MKVMTQISMFTVCVFSSSLGLASITSPLPISCGYADFVFDEIFRMTGEKSILNKPLTGKQGETGRRFLMYGDHSWVLTFEYFSTEDVARDLSCIVRTGTEENIHEGMNLLLDALPTLRIGPSLKEEDEARLKLEPAADSI